MSTVSQYSMTSYMTRPITTAGVAQQVVRESVLVLGRLVMPEAAIRVGVQAVGREDDVEVESSHRNQPSASGRDSAATPRDSAVAENRAHSLACPQ